MQARGRPPVVTPSLKKAAPPAKRASGPATGDESPVVFSSGEKEKKSGVAGIEALEALGDAGNGPRIEITPITRIAHHFTQRVLA